MASHDVYMIWSKKQIYYLAPGIAWEQGRKVCR